MPKGEVYTYDSNEVSVVACSIPIDGGWAEDDFIAIAQDSNDYDDVVTVDGDVVVSKTNDLRATVTLRLIQTARANSLLSALRNLGLGAPNGAGMGVFQVRDGNGTLLHFAEKSWIMKPPEIVFGKTAKGREWSIRVGRLLRNDGGV